MAQTTAPVHSGERDRRSWASSRSRSVWRWQLVLAASTVSIAVAMALLDPSLLAAPQVIAGLVVIVLTTCTILALPWRDASDRLIAIVPFVDIIGIGALSWGTDARLTYLWVFPIAWIATYYPNAVLFSALGLTELILVADGIAGGLTTMHILRVVIVSLALTFIGITISAGSRRSRAYSRLLQRQFRQIGRSHSRLEAQHRRGASVVNAVDVPLAGVGFDGRLLTANEAFRQLYRIDDLRFAHLAPPVEYDAFEGEPLPPHRTTRARAAAGEVFANERVWLFDADGEWHTLDASSRRIEAGSREPESMLLVIKDVTEVIRAERDRQSMARVVSHELRNPLTAIVGRTDLLLERDDIPENVRSQLEAIETASQRMEHLISTVLDSARPPQHAEPTASRVDLSAVIAASVEAFAPAAEHADIDLLNDTADGLLVTGDSFRLRQVVDNLIGNAVKYTPRGGHVTVSGSCLGTSDATGGGAARLVVEDTGIGIAAEDLPRIFEPYFRAQSALDGHFPGTGLGMGITRTIVEQQGGTFDVDSELGEGTRMTVTLPAPHSEPRSEPRDERTPA